ncbi:hypothetical protein [Saccharopolyspora shandongensis]|uniref:hypothetical protein n=1 Tax=Saccharopolyspora shandongensis TaxID=418495 RepID=UPI0034112A9F
MWLSRRVGLVLLGSVVGASVSVGVAHAAAPQVVTSAWSGKAEAVSASCPSGTDLAGGGYDSRPATTGNGANADAVDLNAPSDTTPNSWTVKMHIGTARAYAMCT